MRKLLIGIGLINCCFASTNDHLYSPKEKVIVWADTVKPLANPIETYPFHTAYPTCELWETGVDIRQPSLAETLAGHQYVASPRIKISFPDIDEETDKILTEPLSNEEICRMRLTQAIVTQMKHLIDGEYLMSYSIDGLPVYGMIGTKNYKHENSTINNPPKEAIYTHKRFILERNNHQIVGATMITSVPAPLILGAEIRFSYDVIWRDNPSLAFSDRLNRYEDGVVMYVGEGDGYMVSKLTEKIHWMSICNCMALTVFLIGVTAVVINAALQGKGGDSSSRDKSEDIEIDMSPIIQPGWRQLSKDVFRRPKHLLLFSLSVGSGSHFLALFVSLIALACARSWHHETSMSPSTIIICWALLQPVGSCVGLHVFLGFGGRKWKNASIWQLIITPTIISFTFLQLNSVALVHGSSLAAPFSAVASLLSMFLLVNVPLHAITTFLVQYLRINNFLPSSLPPQRLSVQTPKFDKVKLGSEANSTPARGISVHALERPIPLLTPFKAAQRSVEPFIIGVVPFSSLLIETHLILTSFWSPSSLYRICGLLALTFCLYICSLVAVSVLATYFLLDQEDHRWTWYSFWCGGSSTFYMFLMGTLFFVKFSAMTGLFQSLYFFAVTGVCSAAVGLASGATSFCAASWLVNRMYAVKKSD